VSRILRLGLGGVGIVVLLCALYLGVRIIDERAKAPEKVASIIAAMDPAIDRISAARIEMLLAVEDPTFWSNDGIDLATPGAGMTSLAQGLGKQIFFERFRPGLQKIELMLLTRFALIPAVPREDILRAMLANAYLGHDAAGPIVGFSQGAQRVFGKPLDALTDRDWLALVAVLPAPNTLHPIRNQAANAERVARIERLLAGACRPEGVGDVMLEGCK
jgi:membrane peptidoglycan carboxypeptidase